MGYRSEVVLAVSKQLQPHFLAAMAKQPEAIRLVFSENTALEKDYDGEGTLVVAWDDIKWYTESDPVIAAVQDFVDACDAEEEFEGISHNTNHFRFLRLGEDVNDVQDYGYLCSDRLYWTRTIHGIS